MAMLRATILMENKDLSSGIASEKWYLNYSNDNAAFQLMLDLRDKRRAFMYPGAMIRAVRGEVVNFDANGRPKRDHTLESVGIIKGGLFGTFPASSYLLLSGLPEATGGGRNTGPSLLLKYNGGPSSARYETIPFCPLGSFADTTDETAQQKFESSFGQNGFKSRLASYYNFLIANGASQVVRKPNSTPFPIVAATSGDPNVPLLATITVAGNQTAILSPNTQVIVGQRRAKKGYGQQKYKELNGVHTVMASDFNATTNMTTISLTCTVNTVVDLCRSAGNVRVAQYILQTLASYDTSSNARARRSRKNVVQI